MWKHCALLALLTSGCVSARTKPPVAISSNSDESKLVEPEIALEPEECCYTLREPALVHIRAGNN